MKTASKIALAIALVAGVSAASITLNAASAGGWGYGGYGWNNPQDGTWMGRRGGMRGGMMGGGMRGGMMGPGGYYGAAGPAFGGAMMLQQFDANNDGVLTREEVDNGFAAKVTENDKDGDHAISVEEFKNEWLKMTQNRMVRGFQRLDSDADGKITPAELKSHADAMFAFMDSNGDGKLDQNDGPRRGMGYGPGFGPRFMNGPMVAPAQPAPAPSTNSAQ